MLGKVLGQTHPHDARCDARTTAASCIAAAIWRGPSEVLTRRGRARPQGARRAACVRRPRSGQSRHGATGPATPMRDAEQDFARALDIYAESLPADHPYVASALSGLGRAAARTEAASRRRNRPCAQATHDGREIAVQRQPAARRGKQRAGTRALLAQGRSGRSRAAASRKLSRSLVKAQGEDAVTTHDGRKAALAKLDAARRTPMPPGLSRLSSASLPETSGTPDCPSLRRTRTSARARAGRSRRSPSAGSARRRARGRSRSRDCDSGTA